MPGLGGHQLKILAILLHHGIIAMMIDRLAFTHIRQLLTEFPAVAILGPRQVGKTTLAWQVADTMGADCVYIDLESPSDQAKLTDPEAFLQAHAGQLVILDEVQRTPDLFTVLRGVIDQRRRAHQRTGQFLLLGSASGQLLAQSSESLAGRLAYAELSTLLALEAPDLAKGPHEELWVRGGFPDSLLAKTDAASMRWRQQFITTYLERDIPQLGPRIPAQTLRRLWTMLAHEQGQLINAAKLAASLAVSGQTVARYVDLLCDLMLVRRLLPWASNEGKRLVRAPKIYVRDSGLVHALLGLPTRDAVLGHPVAGGSWEGWVIENLIAAAPEGMTATFYRTSAGAEVDLVLDLPNAQRWAIEIKRSKAPVVSKGFHTGSVDVQATHRWVVYPGDAPFPMAHGITAAPLRHVMNALRQGLG
jgi:predicted AAA+ superfamily ATPase